MQTQCPVNAGAWKASHFLNFSGGDLDVTMVKSHAVSTFSSAVGNQTSTARATGGNLKREKRQYTDGAKECEQQSCPRWLLQPPACDLLVVKQQSLSHLPCAKTQWNSTALSFGLSVSFSFIGSPYLLSPHFYFWILLFLYHFNSVYRAKRSDAEWQWL